MTAITLERGTQIDVRSATLDELADALNAALAAGDEETTAAITAEADRRDQADKRRRARRAEPLRAEWTDAAHAQWLDAERECRGRLLSDAGMAAGVDPWSLWSGPMWRAARYMSEELRNYWLDHPRITITDYQRQERAAREAHRDQLDRDEADRVRCLAGTDQESAPVRCGSTGDAVPPAAARGEAQASAGTGPDGDPGHVRGTGGRPMTTTEEDAAGAARQDRAARAAALRSRLGTREPVRAAPYAGHAGERDAGRVAVAASAYGASQGAVAVREPGTVVSRRAPAVDGGEALEYARKFLGHYALWPSPAALTTAALWAAHAHARDAAGMLVWLSSPRLLFSSAEPGSGKSAAMKLVARLCPSPALLTEPSEPALAHSIGADRATLFLDEADVYFGRGSRKAAARAIINDGYSPDGEWARVRGGQVHRISTFGALAMAGLDKMDTGTDGQLAATLSRCIRVRMRRGPEDYRPPRFDHQARYAASVICERLGMWAKQELPALASHVPEVPGGIGNRPAELWEPLLAVADIAGGAWPDLAWDACEEMVATGGQPHDDEDKAARLEEIMASWDEDE